MTATQERRIYGYCRISTPKQNIERQARNIRAMFPMAIIIMEVYTATTQDRPRWQKLLKMLRPGDMVVFDSVSRMSRNAQEGFAEYKMLYEAGIELYFLKEPHINTSVYRDAGKNLVPMTGTDVDLILSGVNKYLMRLAEAQIHLAFEMSEKEVQDLKQRTKEGMLTAKMNGVQMGRPAGRKYETEKSRQAKASIFKMSKSFSGTMDDKEVYTILNISPATFYRYKKLLKDESKAMK